MADEYKAKLAGAGFENVGIEPTRVYSIEDARDFLSGRSLNVDRLAKEATERADLRRELEAIPPIAPDDTMHEGDQTDHASADTDREFDVINRARVQSLLHQIEQALVRLENGSYGFCEVTGEPIGLKRLMAQPATPLSLAAQEERERRAR